MLRGRAWILGVATVPLLVAAVLLFRHGIQVNHFPAFVAGARQTDITRYSGPWIAASFGAALLAALAFTAAVLDAVRRRVRDRSRRRAGP